LIVLKDAFTEVNCGVTIDESLGVSVRQWSETVVLSVIEDDATIYTAFKISNARQYPVILESQVVELKRVNQLV